MLTLVRRISEQRHRLIVDRAQPFLDDGEEVIHWVRAKRADGRGTGFVYLTVRRCVIVWTNRPSDCVSIPWDELHAWGVKPDEAGGPLLGVRARHGIFLARIVAATARMAEEARAFVRRFSELAGASRKTLEHPDHGTFVAASAVDVSTEKRSIGGLTKRFVVTILGAALTALGIIIIPFPGPWSLPLILAGLAVLGSEYDWAKDTLEWSKDTFQKAKDKLRARRRSKT